MVGGIFNSLPLNAGGLADSGVPPVRGPSAMARDRARESDTAAGAVRDRLQAAQDAGAIRVARSRAAAWACQGLPGRFLAMNSASIQKTDRFRPGTPLGAGPTHRARAQNPARSTLTARFGRALPAGGAARERFRAMLIRGGLSLSPVSAGLTVAGGVVVGIRLAREIGGSLDTEGDAQIWPLWWLPVVQIPIPPPPQPGQPRPPLPPGWVIPIRRFYYMLHDIEVVRLPGREPLPVGPFTIGFDADARDRSFSARLYGPDAIASITPASPDEPVVLEAAVDGYIWQFVVDDWQAEEKFGQRSINVRGRSLSALLDAPWQLPSSGASATDETAQQIAIELLPAGWSLTWQLDDWLLPAGALTWQAQTSAQILQRLAKAAGGVAVPAKAAQSFTVQPRYPVAPWQFAAATPALSLGRSAVTVLSKRFVPVTQANGIVVYGGSVGGVLGQVRLYGTAGDRVAPEVQDPLITHADAARQRGIRELAALYRQPQLKSFSVPLGGVDFPLVEVGQMVRVEDGADVHLGIVNAVQITVEPRSTQAMVRQIVTLGEDTPNLFAQFARLQNVDPMLIGAVTEMRETAAVVELNGGGSLLAVGQAAVGQTVFVRAGAIVGQAPAMAATLIEV